MPRETYQLAGNAASLYEAQKVPAIFAPLAEATLDVLRPRSDEALLDVACGTGIFARLARRRLGPGPRVVGADLNEGMIAIARDLSDEDARSCDWHVADVTGLPFPDRTFSLVVCQQGIQFFPDEVAALREMRRVTVQGGRVALSVWAGASPFFTVLAAALSRHVSDEIGTRSLAPFAYDGSQRLPKVMSEVGLMEVSSELLTVDRVIPDAAAAIPREILANPVGATVERFGPEVMERIVADTLDSLSEFRRDDGLVVPQSAHLFQGRVR